MRNTRRGGFLKYANQIVCGVRVPVVENGGGRGSWDWLELVDKGEGGVPGLVMVFGR